MSYNQVRVRRLNQAPIHRGGDYVLLWMQGVRRLESSHALDYAARCATELGVPLVAYEGLRLDYPWSSQRISTFVLEGMRDNAVSARALPLHYWPFVERTPNEGRGLLRRIAARACLVVTDDFPCFILPEQSAALASIDRPLYAVDGNSIVPLAALGDPPYAANHLRRRIHKVFREAWAHRSSGRVSLEGLKTRTLEAPFELAALDDPKALGEALPIDSSVGAVASRPGGRAAALRALDEFIRVGLPIYAEERSIPAPPQQMHGSGLSPYLHFGHLAIEEVVAAVFAAAEARGHELRFDEGSLAKRAGFFSLDPNVDSFLDEAITWRDVGYVWHWKRRKDTRSLDAALPKWAQETLTAHAGDRRSHTYGLAEWESASTHDPLWNAAQRELVHTGSIHNYLRMLWGKKVIEWSQTPEEAYQTLVHLNNKYALDGRNPNSYTGILWCFGLFDRPWAPERPVFGSVRYMSSESTAKKFKLQSYLAWNATLG
jgi:deoxyribodipyrimidine photo-lyase